MSRDNYARKIFWNKGLAVSSLFGPPSGAATSWLMRLRIVPIVSFLYARSRLFVTMEQFLLWRAVEKRFSRTCLPSRAISDHPSDYRCRCMKLSISRLLQRKRGQVAYGRAPTWTRSGGTVECHITCHSPVRKAYLDQYSLATVMVNFTSTDGERWMPATQDRAIRRRR
jgi:hypothetical protein